MDDKKYLQLSISAFITAIVIGLPLITVYCDEGCMDRICWFLFGISMLTGLFFLYKYKINDSNTDKWEWINNLVEKVYAAIPQIALVPPLIVVASIIMTNNINEIKIAKSDDKDILETIDTNINTILTEISTISTPIPCLPCCATLTPTVTSTLTPTLTFTPITCLPCCATPTPSVTSTLTKTQITGCVITYGLNVRTCPGVTEIPSNHAKMWLKENDCITILETSSDPWASIEIEGSKRWIRLYKGDTNYVVTVTPSATPTTTQP